MRLFVVKKEFEVKDIKFHVDDILGEFGIRELFNTNMKRFVKFNSTFSVNPYKCCLCGKKGAAMEKVLCDQKVGMGQYIICEVCALKSGVEIEDIRNKV